MSSTSLASPSTASVPAAARLDYLDAARAFALLLGVAFHGSLSFMPFFIGWAVQDVSTCSWVPSFVLVSHAFRMGLFFFIAGFFTQRGLLRHGAKGFLRRRLLQLGIPLVAGWFVLRPLVVSGWVMGGASLRGNVSIAAGLREGLASLKVLPQGLFTGTHLWFLYYLLLVTVATLTLRFLLSKVGRLPFFRSRSERRQRLQGVFISWISKPFPGLLLLAVPTAVALAGMDGWGMDTPDRSLWPHWPVLSVYGLFFLVGCALGRDGSHWERFIQITPMRVLCAAVGISLMLSLAPYQAQPSDPHFEKAHWAFNAAYALTMWSLTAVTLGLFRLVFSRPRAGIRFLADAAYWMYLVHLPVIVWLQVAVAEIPVPGGVKLAAIVGLTVAVSLASYGLVVRNTRIGAVLRGEWPARTQV